MTNSKTRKKLATIVIILAIIALLLTGTFAYVLNNQHKSDYLRMENRIYDLTLINNFNSYDKNSWSKDEIVPNPILVKSSDHTEEETYTDAYVAVQLMEYLKAYTRGEWLTVGDVKGTADATMALFAIDSDGNYMSFAATETQLGADSGIVKYPASATDTDAFAMINGTQKEADQNAFNGIHGKQMRNVADEYEYGTKEAYDHIKENGAEPVRNDECDAEAIESFENTIAKAREYVSFELGDYMLLSDWQAKYTADNNDPELTGKFWIIDDSNPTNGWAYWAEPLSPGDSTTELLKNIKLEKDVTNIDYYMHVDLASADIEDIDILNNNKSDQGALMPEDLINYFKGKTDSISDGIPIDEVNFPDPVFRQYVSETFDTEEPKDEILYPGEIEKITILEHTPGYLSSDERYITNLTGIEHFKYLEELYLFQNNDLPEAEFFVELKNFDPSLFKDLKILYLCGYIVDVLDISQNEKLEYLVFACKTKEPHVLEINNQEELETIYLEGSNFKEINIKNNPKLLEIDIEASEVKKCVISNNQLLYKVKIVESLLEEINITDSEDMHLLTLNNNKISSIDLSTIPTVGGLYLQNNNIKHLDISMLPNTGKGGHADHDFRNNNMETLKYNSSQYLDKYRGIDEGNPDLEYIVVDAE